MNYCFVNVKENGGLCHCLCVLFLSCKWNDISCACARLEFSKEFEELFFFSWTCFILFIHRREFFRAYCEFICFTPHPNQLWFIQRRFQHSCSDPVLPPSLPSSLPPSLPHAAHCKERTGTRFRWWQMELLCVPHEVDLWASSQLIS